jgi:succinate dehydrogenase/fumarate reductase flavoprotein subunit
MPLRFLNIRSGEELIAESEPQIAALWGSSDRGPNVNQGQDFGWRFAPEVVVEMKDIMSDPAKIQDIANRFRKMYDDITETDVFTWIANRTELMAAPVAEIGDYQKDYDDQIKRLEAQKKKESVATTTDTTTESLADLQKRVELQERLAAASVKTTTTTTTKK